MKPMVAYPLLAIVFLLFFALHQNPHVGPAGCGSRRMFRERSIFDPLIEKIERRVEGGGGIDEQPLYHNVSSGSVDGQHSSSTHQFSDEHDEEEEFFDEEGRFNVTERLTYLFPLLDRWPKDGWVSTHELEYWILGQAIDRMTRRTEEEISNLDKDGDGSITLKEYLPHLSDQDFEINNMLPGQAGWWKERFAHADLDGDGSLNYSEFKDFLYPEDSGSSSSQQWLQKDKIRQMDKDGDGKLNFVEFRKGAYELYKSNMELENDHEEDPYYIPDAEGKFAELDQDKDRNLSNEELEPIMHHLFPGELAHAAYYTKFLIRESDEDQDGKLTLKEMLDNRFAFYSPLYEDNKSDYEDNRRDELR